MLHSVTPYLTRRARLLLGMTQAQFAEMFDVDVTTVSRWERGKLRPHPEAWKRIRQIAGATYDLVRASPVAKYVVSKNDLLRPSLISKGLERILKRYGIDAKEVFLGDNLRERAHRSAQYPVSGMHALEMIQADPRWRDGSAVYAEAHCVAVLLGHSWSTLLVAPLPDGDDAILEWGADTCDDPAKEGFWVRFVMAEELSKRPPHMMASEGQHTMEGRSR
jgi:transcriptional regulator with XRE-family HTH domain